jgi:hypothetical protein
MDRVRSLSGGGAALIVVAVVVHAAACFNYIDDCERALTCPPGTGGGTPAVCDPSKNKDPVADTCGVFVSPNGDDGAAGTKAKPLKTITAALAKGTTIYACAGAMPYSEAIVLDKETTIFGALDCVSWAHDAAKKTALTAASDAVPVTIAITASGAEVVDFAITAADAMLNGGSSIAVVVNGATASFARTDITAGKGKDGLAGMTPTDSVGPTDPTDPAIKGNGGLAACMSMSSQLGGDAKDNTLCPTATGGPLGGAGGVGAVNSGSNGDANPATSQTALGGQGQPSMDPTWSCAVGVGATGANGAPGAPGAGAKATDIGTLDKSGYIGSAGQSGSGGKPGQGGGGGGGAKGKTMCAGASGGGGGAGGCPGQGGLGGMSGGASIGIVSLGAALTFDAVTIKAGAGGNGGDGGDGQGGGVGGNGGDGGIGDATAPVTSKACNGGAGGQGGTGGKGGGGRGGHALGIAYVGKAPPKAGVTFTKGTAGAGGAGDHAMGNMGDGAAGVAADVQVFQ